MTFKTKTSEKVHGVGTNQSNQCFSIGINLKHDRLFKENLMQSTNKKQREDQYPSKRSHRGQ